EVADSATALGTTHVRRRHAHATLARSRYPALPRPVAGPHSIRTFVEPWTAQDHLHALLRASRPRLRLFRAIDVKDVRLPPSRRERLGDLGAVGRAPPARAGIPHSASPAPAPLRPRSAGG